MPSTTTKTSTDLPARLRYVIGRLHRLLRRKAAPEMTPTQLSVLYVIERKQPVPLGKLAAIEGLAPPSLSRIISSLEEAGLVTRTIDPADRRSVVASLTTQGRATLDRTRTIRNDYLAARLKTLDHDDLAALERATEILESFAEEEI